MADQNQGSRWDDFNAAQVERPPRPFAIRAVEEMKALVGLDARVQVLDIGAGAGVESRLFLEQGWQVLAFDSAASSRELIMTSAGDLAKNLTFIEADFGDIGGLPAADFIYSGFALPFASPSVFAQLWLELSRALKPGGLIAVNLLGENDEWAQRSQPFTFLSSQQIDQLFADFDVVYLREEEGERPAFEGAKYWHNFDVIARKR